MSEPRPYDLDDPDEIRRLRLECMGYLRASRHNGFHVPDYILEKLDPDTTQEEPLIVLWIMAHVYLWTARDEGLDGGDRLGRDYAIEALERLLALDGNADRA